MRHLLQGLCGARGKAPGSAGYGRPGTGGRILGLLAVLLLSACQDMQVRRVEPTAAPVAFSTYALGQRALSEAPGASAQLVELDQDMRDAVIAALQVRGYRQVAETTRADMVVSYQVAVLEEHFPGDPGDTSWDAQFDSNAQRGVVDLPARTSAPRITLTLGIGRPGGAALWGGSAEKLLARPESAEERRRIIGAAVQELLRDLPYR